MAHPDWMCTMTQAQDYKKVVRFTWISQAFYHFQVNQAAQNILEQCKPPIPLNLK
jgi:hypothetical protein